MATNDTVAEAPEGATVGEDGTVYVDLVERTVFNNDTWYFTNNIDACMSAIAANEDNYCFVLMNQSVPERVQGKLEYSYRPRVWQYTKTVLGTTLVVVDDEIDSLDSSRERAHLGLPKMPMTFVRDIDTLFHAVEAKYDAEAIVLLTFDPSYLGTDNPGEGWGFLVPTQENTAGSCNYDHASVEKERPEDVYIVGSAHSHPKMSAFASHTDEGDQLCFDGIHITFGWLSHQPTGYHIEWQMGGTQFELKPEQLFEDFQPSDTAPEQIEAWMKPIKKGYQQYQSSTKPSYTGGTTSHSGKAQSPTGTGQPTKDTSSSKIKRTLPAEIPEDSNSVVVRLLFATNKQCPACKSYLITREHELRRCSMCMTYLLYPDESLSEIVDRRATHENRMASVGLTKDASDPEAVVYVWERWMSGVAYGERVDLVEPVEYVAPEPAMLPKAP